MTILQGKKKSVFLKSLRAVGKCSDPRVGQSRATSSDRTEVSQHGDLLFVVSHLPRTF